MTGTQLFHVQFLLDEYDKGNRVRWWRNIHPTGGKPYEFTEAEASQNIRIADKASAWIITRFRIVPAGTPDEKVRT